MPFIRGVKKGFKFEPIGKYTKEDIEVDVPEIVLPNQNPLGGNQLDISQQSNFKGISTSKIGMIRSNSMLDEEEKKLPKVEFKRNVLYNDSAL